MLETDITKAKPLSVPETSGARRKARALSDNIAAWLVRAAGIAVILSIVGLLASFAFQVMPLWEKAQLSDMREITVPAGTEVMIVGSEEYRQIGFILGDRGVGRFLDLNSGDQVAEAALPLLDGESVTAASLSPDGFGLLAGTNTGRLFYGAIDYGESFSGSTRVFDPGISFTDPVQLDSAGAAVRHLAFRGTAEDGLVAAVLTADNRVLVYSRTVETSLFGAGDITETFGRIEPPAGRPSGLAIEMSKPSVFLGMETGALLRYDLTDAENPELLQQMPTGRSPITLLGFLIGDRSLISGNAKGEISVWFEALDPGSEQGRKFVRAHDLESHGRSIRAFAASERNRSFFTASEDGEVLLQFSTNERLLLRRKLSDSSIRLMRMTPKADGLFVVYGTGSVQLYNVENNHPEANLDAFFGEIWYEGYEGPDYVWQSSGGSDDFEAKLSLIPLIFGTLKGTLYALLFALPIAVMAAIYVAQFMEPNLRGIVKPVMEIMAALPSVVIGFIGGLWLAPRVQPIVPGLMAAIIVVPTVMVLFSYIWYRLPSKKLQNLAAGREFYYVAPLIVILGWICVSLNGPIESTLFAGNFQQWLIETLNLPYDQRNAFVVGLVMGFAVIPIIFTISEDALSNVPKSLTAASLALGATQWQTAYKVALPSASPGIFSASMIGLGRAVGETMIVLMATGNTPIMDWNIFNGFRTLSANIAVEIPEAPEGGTLFRTLFLAASILFMMTFVVNTLAEVVRQRMQRKYQSG